MKKTVIYFGDERAMAGAAAAIFLTEYRKTAKRPGPLTVVLSGGKSPRPFFKALAEQKIPDWTRVFFFFADERLVSRKNPESNFKTAWDLLFSRSNIPPSNISSVPAAPASGAAARYEKAIRKFFGGKKPSFDLLFLGLGTDGHTASIFPGGPAAAEMKKLAMRVTAPRYAGPRDRVTMTLKTLNSAKTAVFLVSGKGKKGIFSALAEGRTKMPAAQIKPSKKLYLLYSRQAAR